MTFPTIPTAGDGRVLTTNQLNTTAARTFPSLSSLTKDSGDLRANPSQEMKDMAKAIRHLDRRVMRLLDGTE